MQAVIIFLLLFAPLSWAAAAPLSSVVINEIAWMGTEASSADEWVELYNNTNEDINLEGWGLYEAGGTVLIEPLTGIIKAKSYYLIERTDDATISDIPASQEPSSWGGYGLNNNGEHLQLLDNNSKVVDEVDCQDDWFAGDNLTKRTMERKSPLVSGDNPGNWQTSQNPGGTPKAENSAEPPAESPDGIQAGPPACETCGGDPIIYPSNIFINEILPSPKGADAENEWIELSNENNFEVELSGWQIRDTVGAVKIYTFSERTKIKSNGFLLLRRSETKITLQNSGDGLEILNPAGEIVHQTDYQKVPKSSSEQSFNRTLSDWQWSTTLTPGETNVIASLEPLITESSEELAEEKEQVESPSRAKIGGYPPKTLSPVITFLIALLIAVSSGIIVLFIKKRIEDEE